MRRKQMMPLLLTPREVKKLIGRLPRGLENMVVSSKDGKRKLYRLGEVLQYANRSR